MEDQLTMIMVCLTNGKQCNEDGFVAEVGNVTHLFCCEDGFKQSVADFTQHLDDDRKHHKNN